MPRARRLRHRRAADPRGAGAGFSAAQAPLRRRPLGLGEVLLVDEMASLAVAIPLFAVIGLSGLFLAHAWPDGSLHDAGLGLFVVSGVIIFLDIKHVFDRSNSRPR